MKGLQTRAIARATDDARTDYGTAVARGVKVDVSDVSRLSAKIARDPGDADGRLRRGIVYALADRSDSARVDLRAVLRWSRDTMLLAAARRWLRELAASRLPRGEVFVEGVLDEKPARISFPSPQYPEQLRRR